ncbi:MarR family transcriptional regulator [Methanocaldococcus indicus]|uniref:MarR family transcriptional regulator n=1 Tax=Methanocaldococcus indicus TaxID=213231 RepID=UPI003C6D6F50
MDNVYKEVVSTIFRKAILHHMLITGSTFPTKLSKDLNISKGLSSSFLRLCSALDIMSRERIGHKVVYSLTKKGIAILKRLAPEIFDLSFSNALRNLSKKRFMTKHCPITKIGFRLDIQKDMFGGITFSFYDYDNNLLGQVFRNYKGIWWCTICKSTDCKHIDYVKKLYDRLEKTN